MVFERSLQFENNYYRWLVLRIKEDDLQEGAACWMETISHFPLKFTL